MRPILLVNPHDYLFLAKQRRTTSSFRDATPLLVPVQERELAGARVSGDVDKHNLYWRSPTGVYDTTVLCTVRHLPFARVNQDPSFQDPIHCPVSFAMIRSMFKREWLRWRSYSTNTARRTAATHSVVVCVSSFVGSCFRHKFKPSHYIHLLA